MSSNQVKVITIDATDRTLGRVASEVAVKLRGKHLPSFAANVAPPVKVKVINLAKLRFTGSKLETKKYYRFSGYPSGLKVTNLRQELAKNPVRLFRRAVEHMLPKNKLSSRLIKNLTIHLAEPETK